MLDSNSELPGQTTGYAKANANADADVCIRDAMTGGRWTVDGGRWTVVGRPDCRSESGLLTLDSCTAVGVGVDVGIRVAGVGEPVGRRGVVSFKKNALRLPRAATAT